MKFIEPENLQNHLQGKTIEKVDTSAVNCTEITFTDGSRVLIETEYMGQNFYGPAYYELEVVQTETKPGE